jgi:hypothetical protein
VWLKSEPDEATAKRAVCIHKSSYQRAGLYIIVGCTATTPENQMAVHSDFVLFNNHFKF